MKTLVQKVLLIVTLTIASVIAAQAQYTYQLEEKILPVGAFQTINVSDDFEVTLAKGTYSAKVTVDNVLSPYVQVYVRSKTLYVDYDQKAVPKDIKNLYKGKNTPTPVLRVTVYMPELNGITLSDNASIVAADSFDGNSFDLTLNDKAQVRNLSLNCNNANVTMKKNTSAVLTLVAKEKINLNTEGNASLQLIGNTEEMVVTAEGSSVVVVTGDSQSSNITTSSSASVSCSQKTKKVTLQMGGSSTLTLNGEAESLLITSEKSASLEANEFIVKKVDANMSGSSKANVNVTESVDATLVGGSALYYTGTPEIKIGKVIKSTLAPFGSTAK